MLFALTEKNNERKRKGNCGLRALGPPCWSHFVCVSSYSLLLCTMRTLIGRRPLLGNYKSMPVSLWGDGYSKNKKSERNVSWKMHTRNWMVNFLWQLNANSINHNSNDNDNINDSHSSDKHSTNNNIHPTRWIVYSASCSRNVEGYFGGCFRLFGARFEGFVGCVLGGFRRFWRVKLLLFNM